MEERVYYVKRSHNDFSINLNLKIVCEVERGETSILAAQRKYGIQRRATITVYLRKFDYFN
jgi:hypothetical protein